MKRKIIPLIILSLLIFIIIPAHSYSMTPHDEENSSFPREQSTYEDGDLDSILEIILHRIKEEPFNLFATIIFILAIIHTMLNKLVNIV